MRELERIEEISEISENKEIEKVPEVSDNAIDAAAFLTGLGIGDIKDEINNGNFYFIALKALETFYTKYYHQILGDPSVENELDEDVMILEHCFRDIKSEIEKCDVPHIQQELAEEAKNMRAQINLIKKNS